MLRSKKSRDANFHLIEFHVNESVGCVCFFTQSDEWNVIQLEPDDWTHAGTSGLFSVPGWICQDDVSSGLLHIPDSAFHCSSGRVTPEGSIYVLWCEVPSVSDRSVYETQHPTVQDQSRCCLGKRRIHEKVFLTKSENLFLKETQLGNLDRTNASRKFTS